MKQTLGLLALLASGIATPAFAQEAFFDNFDTLDQECAFEQSILCQD